MPVRTAEAEWKGSLNQGTGRMRTETGSYEGGYSFGSRFEEAKGTNPEELIAAAHASCFTMATAFQITNAGHEPTELSTVATVSMEKQDSGWSIVGIALALEGSVPGLTADKFQALADEAKRTCPISRALAAVPITMTAKFR